MYNIIDSSKTVLATGETREETISNLIAWFVPGDFDCENWDEVIAEWESSEDGLGDLMCINVTPD